MTREPFTHKMKHLEAKWITTNYDNINQYKKKENK